MQPWKVVENVPRDILVSPGDQGRRRVVFRPKDEGAGCRMLSNYRDPDGKKASRCWIT
jgi:hypothetical protein